MADKKIIENIKSIKKFLEFWTKFHEIYVNAVSSSKKTEEDQYASRTMEDNFISTRSLVNSRFQDLMDLLSVNHADRMTKALCIYEVLSVESLSEMSDEKIEKIEDFWTDSFVFLSSLLIRFQTRKKRLEKFNRISLAIRGIVKKVRR